MNAAKIAIAVALWSAGSTAAAEWTAREWPQVIYYRYTFSAPASGRATLHLTSIDEYEVFFNGRSLGENDDWTTMDEYPLSLVNGDNELAVQTTNRGQRIGAGLIAEIRDEDETVNRISRAGGVNEVWRWTAEPQRGTAWQRNDVIEDPAWRPVQLGYLDREGVGGDWEDTLGAEVVAGFPGGIDIGRPEGGLTLRTVFGENIALGFSSSRPEAFDGNGDTAWKILILGGNISLARVDLETRRLVSEVRVLTQGKTAEQFETNSLQSYVVEISDDGIQWVAVRTVTDITDFEQTVAAFAPLFTRFVRVLSILPQHNAAVAEVQVFGEGFAPDGQLLSDPLDLGRAGQRKNFDGIHWFGDIPEGTSLSIRFRSSDNADTWSGWSSPITEREAALQVPEPRRWLQYSVDMVSQFEDTAPRLDSLTVFFGEEVPASGVSAWVVPNRATLGVDTVFTYTLDATFGDGDLGVERLRIATPSRAQVEEIRLPDGVSVADTIAWGDALELYFDPAWNTSGQLSIDLRARLLSSEFEFRPQVFGLGLEGEVVSLDGEEGTSDGTWTVQADDVREEILSAVRVRPPAFSPNGDGVNDGTVVEFILARLNLPQRVDIEVYDLRGRRVRSLNAGLLSRGEYVTPSGGGDVSLLPGYWDGKDDAGDLVPPGLYAVRVRARLDQGDETRTRTVAVVY